MVAAEVLEALFRVIEERRSGSNPDSYVARLSAAGRARILQKVGEEAVEVVIAGLGGDDAEVVNETADLWFHTLVMLAERGISPERVLGELARRFGGVSAPCPGSAGLSEGFAEGIAP
ncbi:MAG: phosphoribosyl-ATP diphosphatase [Magnetococcales bacterium]|nr:phosphoribosyl-ATP diphosphatase [Magnetococcales bacterium]